VLWFGWITAVQARHSVHLQEPHFFNVFFRLVQWMRSQPSGHACRQEIALLLLDGSYNSA